MNSSVAHCEGTAFDEKGIQYGGQSKKLHKNSRCNTEWSFAFNYEFNFMYDIEVDSENRARGCNLLDLDMNEIEALDEPQQVLECPLNKYAPEGKSVHKIVKQFAKNHDHWAETFLDAWHKMQANGYGESELTDGPKTSWIGFSYLDPGIYIHTHIHKQYIYCKLCSKKNKY